MANFTSDFIAWATGVGANVAPSPATYAAMPIVQQGAQQGIGDPVSFNSAMRQGTSAAAMIAKFTADWGPGNVVDNGNIPAFEAQFVAALQALIATLIVPTTGSLLHWGGTDTGIANSYIFANPSPAIPAYTAGTAVLVQIAHANTAGSVVKFGNLPTVDIVRLDGSALQNNDMLLTGIGLIAYNGTRFVLLGILQTISGVPVATYTTNGITRESTVVEAAAATTTGTAPAFVTPEGLASYASKWTVVYRTASGNEPAVNEYVQLAGATNFTTTLLSPIGRAAAAYFIYNSGSVNQNIATAAALFWGGTDFGDGLAYIVLPPGARASMYSDGNNWVVTSIATATTSNRGAIRVASNPEALIGVTNGSIAAMTPEDVALYVNNLVATIYARGIAREASMAEAMAGVTSGSAPAFVTPEEMAAYMAAHMPVIPTPGILPIGAVLTSAGMTTSGGGGSIVGTIYTSGGGIVGGVTILASALPDGQTWKCVGFTSSASGASTQGTGLTLYLTFMTLLRIA